MIFSLAPMEGITNYLIRNAYHHHFDDIDRYYTPFLPASKRLSPKMKRDLMPENNKGITLIPQILAKRSVDVLHMCDLLKEYGYDTLNINLGCPSGTVVNKGRGAGFLRFPQELDQFLYEIFEKTEFKISVKTRVGFDSDEEWENLLSIYHKYPLEELIIHPRIQKDFYKGNPRMETFSKAYETYSKTPSLLCYNGDIDSVKNFQTVQRAYPLVERFMLGRGLLAKPGLVGMIKKQLPSGDVTLTCIPLSSEEEQSYKKRLRAYIDEIMENLLKNFSGERDILFHMKEIWFYLHHSFADAEPYLKQIQKTQSLAEYRLIVNAIFSNCRITEF